MGTRVWFPMSKNLHYYPTQLANIGYFVRYIKKKLKKKIPKAGNRLFQGQIVKRGGYRVGPKTVISRKSLIKKLESLSLSL